MTDRDRFYTSIRTSLFGGKLKPKQVEGIEAILAVWQADDARELAYGLATAYHETGFTMQPAKEKGGAAYLRRMYDPHSKDPARAALARKNGNLTPGDGVRYAGRGFVQLTWKANYKRMGEVLGIDLINEPDLAVQPDIAARILFVGMTRGLFSGKALGDYFTQSHTDWIEARRIINGVDRASTIAGYARQFHVALTA
ncbi:glycoside hydrolase family 19 protein [Asticcacaulis sp. YBE204]|uniref:glycoside hydrolase family 19 protein n=1 Tax=Asticcacaulis sp. YBE204 TaxID=1282363 RepID=UPI0003C408E8|nr:glycoside hydrolase family 19 protein [Asticcacaulis sp. YBE204]ESQ76947.1 hypothetical protein AEYBE204_18905 [Asticcacaulis sp. YBE204]